MHRKVPFIIAVAMSLLFTAGLVYVTLEIPRAISRLLLQVFPDYALMGQWEKVGEAIESLRPFGYAAFVATLVLIFVGFAAKKWKLSTLGSISLFLPTFGYFAFTMFFLAGIGIVRALWFPLIDSPLLSFGSIVYLPYQVISSLFAFIGIDVRVPLSFIFMEIGALIFFLGVLTWLYGRFKDLEIIDMWIYRYSRHPQYFGFLLWSYGLLILATLTSAPRGGYVPPPSLPWLISALTIIGIALQEENMMVKKHGDEYVKYRSNAPFMMPLPKLISSLINAPIRILLKKNLPENGKEVAFTISVYGIILILLSLLPILFF